MVKALPVSYPKICCGWIFYGYPQARAVYDKPFPDAFVIDLGYAQILYSSCSRYHPRHWKQHTDYPLEGPGSIKGACEVSSSFGTETNHPSQILYLEPEQLNLRCPNSRDG